MALRPEVQVEVALYWHQWKLGGETAAGAGKTATPEGGAPPALLDQIGEALARGARDALLSA
jgi:LysR family transcriptional regulator (chromosome initiation inhibitor)